MAWLWTNGAEPKPRKTGDRKEWTAGFDDKELKPTIVVRG